MVSVVRSNLLTKPGYTPYCGSEHCRLGWPRSTFNGEQFACGCGWTSSYEPEFIQLYRQANQKPRPCGCTPPNFCRVCY